MGVMGGGVDEDRRLSQDFVQDWVASLGGA
jgi:hypothetical protein